MKITLTEQEVANLGVLLDTAVKQLGMQGARVAPNIHVKILQMNEQAIGMNKIEQEKEIEKKAKEAKK